MDFYSGTATGGEGDAEKDRIGWAAWLVVVVVWKRVVESVQVLGEADGGTPNAGWKRRHAAHPFRSGGLPGPFKSCKMPRNKGKW